MSDKEKNSDLLKIISEHEFFSGLKQDFLEFLASNASHKHLEAGDVLFRQGVHADRFYLMLDGEISVEVPAIQGPSLTLQRLSKGKILGWSWLIPPYRWDFQARVVSSAELIEFDGKAILDQCETDNTFGYDLFKRFTGLMSERLLAARRKMMDQWDPPGFA
jgi:CRP-like cAMP-binding protein